VARWAPGKRSHQIQNILGDAIANRIFRAANTLNISFQFSDSEQELIIQGLEIDMIGIASERCLGPRDFRYETLAAELDHNLFGTFGKVYAVILSLIYHIIMSTVRVLFWLIAKL
jgi:hypothetical protein